MPSPVETHDSHLPDLQLQKTILEGWMAENELQEKYRPILSRKLLSLKDFSGLFDLVEEAIQKTFIKVLSSSASGGGRLKNWKGVSKNGEAASLGGYLLKIAINQMIELLKAEKARRADDDGMEHIETKAASTASSSLTSRLPPELLATLAQKIRNQGMGNPRLLILEHLTFLGVMQVSAAKLWGWDKTYASPQVAKLQPQRIALLKAKVGSLSELPMLLQQLLVSNTEILAGRVPGTSGQSPELTKAEYSELRDIASTACDTSDEAEQARTLWKRKHTLQALFDLLSKAAREFKVRCDDIPPGKVPEDRQIALAALAQRLEQAMGNAAFHDELSRALELLRHEEEPDTEALTDESADRLAHHFYQLMAVTRWQERLWQDTTALDCLARAMSATRTTGRSRKAPPIPQHDNLRGKAGLLQKELSRVADLLRPMDYIHHIDEGFRGMHMALLKAANASGATLWMVTQVLRPADEPKEECSGRRMLQAVFNPAEEGEGGIVGHLQPLNEGIISYVYHKGGGVYFTQTEGVSGHPGNQKPNAHAKEIDRRLGKTTSAMIAIPFECCGMIRGVLSIVRSGDSTTRFTCNERQILEGFGRTLATSIEKSLMMQIMG